MSTLIIQIVIDNVVKGACCVGGQRVYFYVNAEETRKESVETKENLPA